MVKMHGMVEQSLALSGIRRSCKMRKYLYVAMFIALLSSCSNNVRKEAKEALKMQNESAELSQTEKMFFGYDKRNVYDSSIIIKVKAYNNEDVDTFLASLKDLNVEYKRRENGLVEGEMYVFLKALGDYPLTLKKLRAMDEVLYAEPNYKTKLIDSFGRSRTTNFIDPLSLTTGDLAQDPEADMKGYSLEITEALKAYKEFGYGEHTVWAGIVDSGSNGNHEDLQTSDGSVVKILKTAFGGAKETEIVEITTGDSDDPNTQGGHGTHCTGVICAVGNNGKGIAGVAWKNVKFISYKGLKEGEGYDESIYGSLRDLVDTVRKQVSQEQQATVPVNLSLGGFMVSSYMVEQINYALSKGVLPVVANGNDGQLIANYPAACPGVLSVGASGDNDKKAGFSTYGPWLNVVAPGLEIISLGHLPVAKYVNMSGTSMATPFVTGLVAYLLSFDPTLTPYQIIALLETTADKIDAQNTDPAGMYDENGFSMWYGHGRVNVYKAVKMLKDGKVPAKGETYVETVLHVNVPEETPALYVYEKKTGVLVSMNLPNQKVGVKPKAYYVDIRGLRPGTYNVVFNQKMQEITIGKEKDVEITF